MKIVILGTRGFPNVQGGVESHCENLAVNLAKIGCEVIVITRSPYVDKEICLYKKVKLICVPTIRNKHFETFLHTLLGVFIAFRLKPDILHIQAIGPGLFSPLSRLLKMRVVVTTHGSNYEHKKWGWFSKQVLKLGEFSCACFANQIISVSQSISHEFFERYHRSTAFIPNGVNLHNKCQNSSKLIKFGLQPSKYILSVGRLVPEKGFDVLITAFRRLNLNDFKLVIVGAADHENAYSRMIYKMAQKDPRIILTGFVPSDELAQFYNHCRIFVLPSYYEGLPIALLEAMVYGASCIASDISGNRNAELNSDRYFNPGDSIALANMMEHFISNPLADDDRIQQMNHIKRNFSWINIAQQTLKIYKSAINSGDQF